MGCGEPVSSSRFRLEDTDRGPDTLTNHAGGHHLRLLSWRRHATACRMPTAGTRSNEVARPCSSRFESMKKRDGHHGFVLFVLLCQIACLTMVAFAEHVVRHSKWVGVVFGFSFLFGLILSLGAFGTWRNRSDESSLLDFFQANPAYLAIALATAGEMASMLLLKPG